MQKTCQNYRDIECTNKIYNGDIKKEMEHFHKFVYYDNKNSFFCSEYYDHMNDFSNVSNECFDAKHYFGAFLNFPNLSAFSHISKLPNFKKIKRKHFSKREKSDKSQNELFKRIIKKHLDSVDQYTHNLSTRRKVEFTNLHKNGDIGKKYKRGENFLPVKSKNVLCKYFNILDINPREGKNNITTRKFKEHNSTDVMNHQNKKKKNQMIFLQRCDKISSDEKRKFLKKINLHFSNCKSIGRDIFISLNEPKRFNRLSIFRKKQNEYEEKEGDDKSTKSEDIQSYTNLTQYKKRIQIVSCDDIEFYKIMRKKMKEKYKNKINCLNTIRSNNKTCSDFKMKKLQRRNARPNEYFAKKLENGRNYQSETICDCNDSDAQAINEKCKCEMIGRLPLSQGTTNVTNLTNEKNDKIEKNIFKRFSPKCAQSGGTGNNGTQNKNHQPVANLSKVKYNIPYKGYTLLNYQNGHVHDCCMNKKEGTIKPQHIITIRKGGYTKWNFSSDGEANNPECNINLEPLRFITSDDFGKFFKNEEKHITACKRDNQADDISEKKEKSSTSTHRNSISTCNTNPEGMKRLQKIHNNVKGEKPEMWHRRTQICNNKSDDLNKVKRMENENIGKNISHEMDNWKNTFFSSIEIEKTFFSDNDVTSDIVVKHNERNYGERNRKNDMFISKLKKCNSEYSDYAKKKNSNDNTFYTTSSTTCTSTSKSEISPTDDIYNDNHKYGSISSEEFKKIYDESNVEKLNKCHMNDNTDEWFHFDMMNVVQSEKIQEYGEMGIVYQSQCCKKNENSHSKSLNAETDKENIYNEDMSCCDNSDCEKESRAKLGGNHNNNMYNFTSGITMRTSGDNDKVESCKYNALISPHKGCAQYPKQIRMTKTHFPRNCNEFFSLVHRSFSDDINKMRNYRYERNYPMEKKKTTNYSDKIKYSYKIQKKRKEKNRKEINRKEVDPMVLETMQCNNKKLARKPKIYWCKRRPFWENKYVKEKMEKNKQHEIYILTDKKYKEYENNLCKNWKDNYENSPKEFSMMDQRNHNCVKYKDGKKKELNRFSSNNDSMCTSVSIPFHKLIFTNESHRKREDRIIPLSGNMPKRSYTTSFLHKKFNLSSRKYSPINTASLVDTNKYDNMKIRSFPSFMQSHGESTTTLLFSTDDNVKGSKCVSKYGKKLTVSCSSDDHSSRNYINVDCHLKEDFPHPFLVERTPPMENGNSRTCNSKNEINWSSKNERKTNLNSIYTEGLVDKNEVTITNSAETTIWKKQSQAYPTPDGSTLPDGNKIIRCVVSPYPLSSPFPPTTNKFVLSDNNPKNTELFMFYKSDTIENDNNCENNSTLFTCIHRINKNEQKNTQRRENYLKRDCIYKNSPLVKEEKIKFPNYMNGKEKINYKFSIQNNLIQDEGTKNVCYKIYINNNNHNGSNCGNNNSSNSDNNNSSNSDNNNSSNSGNNNNSNNNRKNNRFINVEKINIKYEHISENNLTWNCFNQELCHDDGTSKWAEKKSTISEHTNLKSSTENNNCDHNVNYEIRHLAITELGYYRNQVINSVVPLSCKTNLKKNRNKIHSIDHKELCINGNGILSNSYNIVREYCSSRKRCIYFPYLDKNNKRRTHWEDERIVNSQNEKLKNGINENRGNNDCGKNRYKESIFENYIKQKKLNLCNDSSNDIRYMEEKEVLKDQNNRIDNTGDHFNADANLITLEKTINFEMEKRSSGKIKICRTPTVNDYVQIEQMPTSEFDEGNKMKKLPSTWDHIKNEKKNQIMRESNEMGSTTQAEQIQDDGATIYRDNLLVNKNSAQVIKKCSSIPDGITHEKYWDTNFSKNVEIKNTTFSGNYNIEEKLKLEENRDNITIDKEMQVNNENNNFLKRNMQKGNLTNMLSFTKDFFNVNSKYDKNNLVPTSRGKKLEISNPAEKTEDSWKFLYNCKSTKNVDDRPSSSSVELPNISSRTSPTNKITKNATNEPITKESQTNYLIEWYPGFDIPIGTHGRSILRKALHQKRMTNVKMCDELLSSNNLFPTSRSTFGDMKIKDLYRAAHILGVWNVAEKHCLLACERNGYKKEWISMLKKSGIKVTIKALKEMRSRYLMNTKKIKNSNKKKKFQKGDNLEKKNHSCVTLLDEPSVSCNFPTDQNGNQMCTISMSPVSSPNCKSVNRACNSIDEEYSYHCNVLPEKVHNNRTRYKTISMIPQNNENQKQPFNKTNESFLQMYTKKEQCEMISNVNYQNGRTVKPQFLKTHNILSISEVNNENVINPIGISNNLNMLNINNSVNKMPLCHPVRDIFSNSIDLSLNNAITNEIDIKNGINVKNGINAKNGINVKNGINAKNDINVKNGINAKNDINIKNDINAKNDSWEKKNYQIFNKNLLNGTEKLIFQNPNQHSNISFTDKELTTSRIIHMETKRLC
ncbi:hypothetical protein PGO_124650 [Plasmodium gonderi]|uniref:Uncharacterized protein n=1 Tax=Plasmodium gonderi TaxID=77519 RepID=A0A1Y1JMM9_PLAGO|nr:hypothetical protein PGO_124650 [Plasmodium gonderi]GAW82467.1 hypothetical protein PGO_124650 [Plasmodium gonderi]